MTQQNNTTKECSICKNILEIVFEYKNPLLYLCKDCTYKLAQLGNLSKEELDKLLK